MKAAFLLTGLVSLCSLAQASVFYIANLDGPSEAPPNASPGTGSATLTYDAVAHTMDLAFTFSGLVGTTTASHIHAATATPGTGTAGVATTTPFFPGFPTGVTSGSYSSLFDLTLASSWNPTFVTAHGGTPAGAETFFATALADGKAYLNIHTTFAPGGEIRGFFAVPEPVSTTALAAGGLGVFAFLRRRSSRK
jgi:hypothetical protein